MYKKMYIFFKKLSISVLGQVHPEISVLVQNFHFGAPLVMTSTDLQLVHVLWKAEF